MSAALKLPSPEQITRSIGNVIQKIDQDPSAANATFSARATLGDGLRSDITIRNFSLVSDEPESLGGTDQGPNPVEIVLGALGACQEIVVKAYASVLNISISKVSVEAQGHLDLKGFFNLSDDRPGFNKVDFKTVIETSETDGEKLEQLRHFAESRCPVLDIIKNPVETNGTITFSIS